MQGNREVLIQHSWAASDEGTGGDDTLPCCLELLPGFDARSCFGKQALVTLQQCIYLLLPS